MYEKTKNISNANICDAVVKEVHYLVRLFLMKIFALLVFPMVHLFTEECIENYRIIKL